MSDNQEPDSIQPSYRSGAVSKLTGIPVETLRVWERRYNIVGPRMSPKGQRRYSSADVTRLGVIKQMVDSGYAIGSIASLDLEQLRGMRDKFALTAPHASAAGAKVAAPPLRTAVVGEAMGLRMQRHPPQSLYTVATSTALSVASETLKALKADALIVEVPTLQRDTAQAIGALARQLGATFVVVEYGFGSRPAEHDLRALGYHLMRAPLDVTQLDALLGMSGVALPPQTGAVTPRRFDSKTLAEIVTTSVALRCECPHHLANLVAQLGNFETYSGECENRSPDDAQLHRYLKDVSGKVRASLELALEKVLEAEGIDLARPPT